MAAKKKAKKTTSGGDLGFEAKLWQAANKQRNNMDAAEYKHVVLGLIFLKYISDAFEAHREKLLAGEGDFEGADPEQKDEYMAENVFWVPREARWEQLQAQAKRPTIGKVIDDAMVAIERENPRLKGVLPKDYARPALDKHRLGELIDLFGSIGLGDAENRSKDILGRVYEYFLSNFASAEGKKAGTYHAWRSHPHPASGHPLPLGEGRGEGNPGYADVAGFCKSASLEEIRSHGHVLTPGRYVGAEEVEDDGEAFEDKMARLTKELSGQFAESARMEEAIRKNLEGLGYGL